MSRMGRRLFGTDGVRGTANVGPMTAENLETEVKPQILKAMN